MKNWSQIDEKRSKRVSRVQRRTHHRRDPLRQPETLELSLRLVGLNQLQNLYPILHPFKETIICQLCSAIIVLLWFGQKLCSSSIELEPRSRSENQLKKKPISSFSSCPSCAVTVGAVPLSRSNLRANFFILELSFQKRNERHVWCFLFLFFQSACQAHRAI